VKDTPLLFLCSLLYRAEGARDEALLRLSARFGEIFARTNPYPFRFTRYYEPEMGFALSKQIVLFRDAIRPGFLPRAKRWTGRIEEELRDPETRGRRVNLDPGYLTPASLVLASTKGAPHRIYLGLDIYGETTLVYDRGEYRPLPWTYPDYRQEEVLQVFTAARRHLLEKGKERARRAGPLGGPTGGPNGIHRRFRVRDGQLPDGRVHHPLAVEPQAPDGG
jgi:hypothetical protein